MAKRYNRDHIEIFHDYGLFIPSRTISMEADEDNTVSVMMANRVIKNLNILASISKDPITMILLTGGGDTVAGMAIYDAIRTLKDIHITVEVRGEASSMGCIVLQAADHRVMMPGAYLMFHAGTVATTNASPDEMLNEAKFIHEHGERCDRIIYNRILEKDPKLSWKKFRQDVIGARYLFADDAVALGLADEVKAI